MKIPREKLLNSAVLGSDPEYNTLIQGLKNHNIDIEEIKAFIENLWLEFEPYADRKFKTQMKKNFHSCYFEMYLANCLIKLGHYKLSSKDSGPDFFINELDAWVECIATNNGDSKNLDKVKDYNYLNPNVQSTYKDAMIPTEKIILRFTNAFDNKEKKFKEYIKEGIVNNNQPCIIAINAAKVNYSRINPGYPRILSALFPIGYQYVTLNKESLDVMEKGIKYSSEIIKSNQIGITKLAFTTKEYSHISGIIFSTDDAWNISDISKIGTNLLFVPNPLAKNPIPENFLKVGRFCKIDTGLINYEITIYDHL
ncbi:MAG: hypothetical protein IPO06_04225 [Leptospiraceae bacterium]|nr:hypothetical protein [Leptospiraceae bacterium]